MNAHRSELLALFLSTLLANALACSSGEDPDANLSPLAQHGKAVYQSVCIACHHADPNESGSLGPANAGASAELLEAKIVRGEYPKGYSPLRPESNVMPRFEYLSDEIPALAAYLDEVKRQ